MNLNAGIMSSSSTSLGSGETIRPVVGLDEGGANPRAGAMVASGPRWSGSSSAGDGFEITSLDDLRCFGLEKLDFFRATFSGGCETFVLGGGEGDVWLRSSVSSSSSAFLARAASFANPATSSRSTLFRLSLFIPRPRVALSGSGEEDSAVRSETRVLISISGFAGARVRWLEAPDAALPGRRGPTRVANGASSESESDEELDVSLSEECLFGGGASHQIKRLHKN
jgi:hypothetical protein